MAKAQEVDAVLLGAVGGPQYDVLDFKLKPEQGLLRLRKEMDLYANLRPAQCFDALADFSSLKPDVVGGLDMHAATALGAQLAGRNGQAGLRFELHVAALRHFLKVHCRGQDVILHIWRREFRAGFHKGRNMRG